MSKRQPSDEMSGQWRRKTGQEGKARDSPGDLEPQEIESSRCREGPAALATEGLAQPAESRREKRWEGLKQGLDKSSFAFQRAHFGS